MSKNVAQQATEYAKKHKNKKRWQKIVTIMAAVVVFCTTYALILPAITMEKELVCTKEEHTHTEECYAATSYEMTCCENIHKHTEACKDGSCGYADFVVHSHTELCYDENGNLRCTLPEISGHTHSDACYAAVNEPTPELIEEKILICTEEESETHAHGDDCYEVVYNATLSDDANSNEETERGELICTREIVLHKHDDSCNGSCGMLEIVKHTHTKECFAAKAEKQLICGKKEHEHTESCYSDKGADTETKAEWEATLPEKLSGVWQEDIIKVAESQLGYHESEENIVIDSDGKVKGYTRYGAWYGSEYSAWCAMYTSFCMHYAGISEEFIPHEASCYRYILALEDLGLYRKVDSEYTPCRGDLIFFDFNRDKQSDHVGIVKEVVTDASTGIITINTIEGNTSKQVKEHSYELPDNDIIGYGDVTQAFENYKAARLEQTYQGADYTVTAKYDKSSLPENAVLTVRELDKDSEEFLMHSAQMEEGLNEDESISFLRLFDVTFMVDGEEVEPKKAVEINITYEEAIEVAQNEELKGVHFAEDEGLEILDATATTEKETENINSNEINDFNFTLNSFSVTGTAVYAVEPRAVGDACAIYLDGTNGGLMSLQGSPNNRVAATEGGTYTLPTTWQAPEKYDYTLRGWYDVTNSKYYAPGTTITVTGNMLFYADWRATSYDVGQANNQVSDTVSTNDFIVTRVFDYSAIFNMQSEQYTGTINNSTHTDKWRHIEQGTVPYNGPYNNGQSLDFIFIDWDVAGEDISYPQYKNDQNDNGEIDLGIFNDKLEEILFSPDNSYNPATGQGVIGKEYIGTADHLFHVMKDPNDEHYGYHYYDSKLNAASYNQTDQRFYVYDYLERTSDSEKDGGAGEHSDFLPFNSPYKNGNGQNQVTYTFAGENGEYNGTTHYEYDAKYNGQHSEAANIGTNYWFGMSIEIEFYLPNDPGSTIDGLYGNQSIEGKDMTFEFSGDDDCWILIDDKLVLDIGSVHGIEEGIINASTGVVTINGSTTYTDQHSDGTSTTLRIPTLQDLGIGEGDHILKFYYLERGGSQSNCSIYFNLTPRYTFEITKEDFESKALLNGAEFTVYNDIACQPGQEAELWTSRAAYENNEAPISTFRVVNGTVEFFGMSAGKNYFIKETKPPDGEGYSCAKGIICVYLDNRGDAEYHVEVIEDPEFGDVPDNPSPGFTVYGFKVDQENQNVYLVITNAVDPGLVTNVEVSKKWADSEEVDHSADSVTVYLSKTDSTGTIEKYREAELNASNDWYYLWKNLPKYEEDGVTEIQYAVTEAQVEGYRYDVQKSDTKFVETTVHEWQDVTSLENGKSYLLNTSQGYLSTTSTSSANLRFETSAEKAQESPLSLWTATTSSNGFRLENGAGHVLSFNYSYLSSGRYFYATSGSATYQTMNFSSGKLSATRNSTNYYMGSTLTASNGRLNSSTSSGSGISITPQTLVSRTVTEEVQAANYYVITNTPIDDETALTVTKIWDTGLDDGDTSLYQNLEATVRLYANGTDTGMSEVLSFRNDWSHTFSGLPYEDENGNVISYTVVEDEISIDWIPEYGEIVVVEGDPPTYTTTVTNLYRWNHDYELPETGGSGTYMYTVGGLLLSAAAIILLYRKKKREKEDLV